MNESEYSKAAVEVLNILKYMRNEEREKIPQSFIDFLEKISDKEYNPNFKEFNIKTQTKEILGYIYISWLANNEENESYKKQIINIYSNSNEEQNINDILKNENLEEILTKSYMENHMVKYKEESIFRNFFGKILGLLGIKTEFN